MNLEDNIRAGLPGGGPAFLRSGRNEGGSGGALEQQVGNATGELITNYD